MSTEPLSAVEPVLTSDEPRPRLGEVLVQAGKLSPRDLERALSAQQELGDMLGRVLVQLGLVSEQDVLHALAKQLSLPVVGSDQFPEFPLEVPGLLPAYLSANQVLPIRLQGDRLDVAMAVPQDRYVLKALHLATGLKVQPHLGLESEIEKAWAQPLSNTSKTWPAKPL